MMLYAITWMAAASLWYRDARLQNQRSEQLFEAGRAQYPTFTDELDPLPLDLACQKKLELQPAGAIVAYIAKSDLESPQSITWDDVLVGVSSTRPPTISVTTAAELPPFTWPLAFKATVDPTQWPRRLALFRWEPPQPHATRYMVAAKYRTLTWPIFADNDSYTRGTGSFSAQVIDLDTLTIVCQGSGKLRMKEAVLSEGSGSSQEQAKERAEHFSRQQVLFAFSMATAVSPLHAICNAGGEALCVLTGRWTGIP